MSIDGMEETVPSKVQGIYAHAQEQGRKLAIRQETEKAARIKERTENVNSFDFVWEQESETSALSNSVRENPSFHSHTSASVRQRPASPSVSSTANLQSNSAEHHEAPPKAIKSADKYKHAGIKENPHTVKQASRRVKTPETATAKKTALKSSQPVKSAANQAAKATKKGTAKLAKAAEKAAVSAVKSIGTLLGGSAGLVAVALSQVGNVGGQPYWSWYGFSSRVEWCACFVSWCGDQCGYIESGFMPKHSYCPTGVEWFRSRGRWQDRNSIPVPGTIIYFDWGGDGVADHVGIVESCDGSTVYTIEGNANNACKQLSYTVGDRRILGYGTLSK